MKNIIISINSNLIMLSWSLLMKIVVSVVHLIFSSPTPHKQTQCHPQCWNVLLIIFTFSHKKNKTFNTMIFCLKFTSVSGELSSPNTQTNQTKKKKYSIYLKCSSCVQSRWRDGLDFFM